MYRRVTEMLSGPPGPSEANPAITGISPVRAGLAPENGANPATARWVGGGGTFSPAPQLARLAGAARTSLENRG
jgi:hypothetical protein